MKPIKRLLAFLAGFFAGASYIPAARQCGAIRPLIFLDPDTGGGSGGGEPKGTLEDQLSTAQSNLAARDATIGTLTTERDAARSDLAARDLTIGALTTERDAARSDVTARDATIGTLTTERDAARSESAGRATRITQLENALGVAGIDPNDLPKVPTGTKPGEESRKPHEIPASEANAAAAEKLLGLR